MKQACETASMFVVDDIKKQTPSARLPQLSKLTASRTKQLCDTSKVACRAGGLIPMRLPIFSLRMLKLLLLPRKSDAGVIRSAVPVAHKYLNKPKPANLLFQNATLSGNQRPDLRTALVLFFDPAFPSVHIVGRLTSKLPSNQFLYIYMTYGCM